MSASLRTCCPRIYSSSHISDCGCSKLNIFRSNKTRHSVLTMKKLVLNLRVNKLCQTLVLCMILILILCSAKGENGSTKRELQERVTCSDTTTTKTCKRDIITLNTTSTLKIKSITQTSTPSYTSSYLMLSSPPGTTFCKYDFTQLNYCWSTNLSYEAMVITPDESKLIASVDGSQAGGPGIVYYIFSLSQLGVQSITRLSGYSSGSFPSNSAPHMEAVNGTHIYTFTNTIYGTIELNLLDISTGSSSYIRYQSYYSFVQIVYSKKLDSILIMYQMLSSKDLRFGRYDYSADSQLSFAGIDCPNSGGSNCAYGISSAKAINDDQTIAYLLFYFEPYKTNFISLNFVGSNAVHGKTFTPSVEAEQEYFLNYYSGLVYMVFRATSSKSVLAIYNTSTDSFGSQTYESQISYRALLYQNSKFQILGTENSKVIIGFSEQEFFKNHLDLQNSTVTINEASDGIATEKSDSLAIIEKTSYTLFSLSVIDMSTIEVVSSQKNPMGENYCDYSLNFYENPKEITIDKELNQTIDFCLINPADNSTTLTYDFVQKEGEDEASYTMSKDQKTGKLNLYNSEASLLTKTYEYTITTTLGNSGQNFTEDLTIKEEIDSEDREVYEAMQNSVIAVGAIASVLGGILGGTLIQALWMVLNQQKLLLFFILIDTYMHVFVRLILTKQNFGLLNFGFLNDLLPDFMTGPSMIDKLNQAQKTPTVEEIGFDLESFVRSYWLFIQLLVLFIFLHTVCIILLCIFPSLSKKEEKESNKKQEEAKEKTKDNKSFTRAETRVNLVCRDSMIKFGVSRLDEQKKESSEFNNVFQERDEESEKSPSHPQKSFQRPLSISSSSQEISSRSSSLASSKSPALPCHKKLLKWFGSKISSNFFWDVYFRMFLESFMGAVLVTVNEIKTNKRNSSSETLSFALSCIVVVIYMAFYVFVCVVGVREMKRRKRIFEDVKRRDRRDQYRERDGVVEVDEEIKDCDKKIYAELFRDLKYTPYAALHQPLNLTRVVIMIFIVALDIFNSSTIWLLFCLILSLQILYTVQAICIPKFDWWPLKVIYILNEIFFTAFIVIFGLLKSAQDWKSPTTKNIVITLIFLNSIQVIFFQIWGNIIQGKKTIRTIKTSLHRSKTPETPRELSSARTQKIPKTPRMPKSSKTPIPTIWSSTPSKPPIPTQNSSTLPFRSLTRSTTYPKIPIDFGQDPPTLERSTSPKPPSPTSLPNPPQMRKLKSYTLPRCQV
ncbi:unnamed protein product [Moneuplotes crassus]|uniref:Uncharacterized protein n=1 Tax=Euplotes crassus TaxID=5936 RepID=A0AAD1Y6G4_EUPCR|nr:unnamed protein product [Moneuplotes crassus]